MFPDYVSLEYYLKNPHQISEIDLTFWNQFVATWQVNDKKKLPIQPDK